MPNPPYHETDRPCFNCHLRSEIKRFEDEHGYKPVELIDVVIDVLADLVACVTNPGAEAHVASNTMRNFAQALANAYVFEVQRRAADGVTDPDPTFPKTSHKPGHA